MSSYLVSDKTINTVVSFICYSDLEWLRQLFYDAISRNGDFGSTVGKALFDMNVNAVEQRYGQGGAKKFRELNYAYRAVKTSLVEVYDAVKELMYQCCEGDVPDTELYKLLVATKAAVADQIIETNRELLAEEKVGRA